MKNFFVATLISLFSISSVYAQSKSAAGNILFILDGSGSMWGQVEGKHKIVIAKEVMTGLVQELPPDIRAGLEVYGHRSKGNCQDIEIVVPVGSGNRQALIEQIDAITPRGKTPITQAFRQAAEQLRALEDETTIVLVSDGKETCEGDPCTLVRELREQGIKIKVHVVGFDVTHDESEQLVCIAEAGGGKYFSADNADQLQEALVKIKEIEIVQATPEANKTETAAEPRKKVIKLGGGLGKISIPGLAQAKPWVCAQDSKYCDASLEGYAGYLSPDQNTLEVPAGKYRLRFQNHYLQNIQVASGETVEVQLGRISIPGLAQAKPWVCAQDSEYCDASLEGYAGYLSPDQNTLEVPAGKYRLRFQNHYLQNIQVASGETVEVQLGRISIPGLAQAKPWVCAQDSEYCDASLEGYAGYLSPDQNTLEVPAGTYRLKFQNQFFDGIEVGPNEEIVLEM